MGRNFVSTSYHFGDYLRYGMTEKIVETMAFEEVLGRMRRDIEAGRVPIPKTIRVEVNWELMDLDVRLFLDENEPTNQEEQ